MKKLNKIILLPLFVFTMLIGIAAVSQTKVYAYAYTTVYLEVGETYKQTTDNTEPIFTYASNLKGTGYDSKGVQVCNAVWDTATIKKRKYFTIAAKNEGVATFYVNRLNSKKTADRVRTVKVRVFKKGVAPSIKNNISHSENDKNDYLNQQVYVYSGNTFATTSTSNVTLPSDVSEDTTKKAVKASLHIYECDSAGNTIANDKKKLNAASALSGSSLSFTAKTTSTVTSTYVRASYKWTSSNGSVRYTPAKIIKVNVYPKPVLGIFQNGNSISSLSMTLGNEKKVNMSVTNIQSGDVLSNQECVIQDKTKVTVSSSKGVWTIKPLTLTNNIPIKLTFKCNVAGVLSKHNGDAYTALSKIVSVNVNALKSVKIDGSLYDKKQIKIAWDKNEDAASYVVYRCETEQGEFKKISEVKDLFFIDDDKDFKYNKTYYYKVRAVGTDGKTMSDFSNTCSVKLIVKKPYIKSVTKSGKYYLVTISGTKYSGFELYSGKNKILLASTTSDTLNIILGKGKNFLYVRAFYKNEKTGAKAYSDYSNEYVKKIKNDIKKVTVKKPTIKSLKKVKGTKKKTKKKTYIKIVTSKKVKDYGADGFEIYISKNKNFKGCKPKYLKKNKKKISFKVNSSNQIYYVKIRAYKKQNKKKIYSAFSGVKSVKKLSK